MTIFKTSLLLSASFLSLSTAQSSQNGNSSIVICPKPNLFSNDYNSTGSVTVDGFRVDDSFPESTWTWSQYIANREDGNRTDPTRTMGLKTNPVQNLSDPSIPYTGCIFVPLDVKFSSKAMQDDGTCSSVFSADCLKEIHDTIASAAAGLSGATQKSGPVDCPYFSPMKSSKCKDAWSGSISGPWLSRNFTPPRTAGGCPPQNPGDSNGTSGSFFSWSTTIRGSATDNYTEYDHAILYPQPLFVSVWLKETNSSGELPRWSDTRIMCIPGNVTEPGSRSATQAQADSGSGKMGSSLFGVAASAALLVLFL